MSSSIRPPISHYSIATTSTTRKQWRSLPSLHGYAIGSSQPNVLLIEAHALILSTLGISSAAQFLRDMAASKTAVIRVRASDETDAIRLLSRYTDKDFSFADAISFVVMGRLGIQLAFSFDRHWSSARDSATTLTN